MQRFDSAQYADPLDLLRRFIPTPWKAVYGIGMVRVGLQTNDITLLPTLPLTADLEVPRGQSVEWRLVRDWDSPAPLEAPIFLSCGALTIVSMGPACLLGIDHEKREIVGFIGTAVDARTHQEVLIPLLLQLTQEIFLADAKLYFVGHSRGSGR